MADTISAGPPRPYGHVCLAYDDPATFRTAARDFLAEGAAAGERVWYLASEPPHGWEFRPDLIRLGEHYPEGAVIDPARGLEAYAAATCQALADGYAGLRVAAEVTPLVRTPAQLDAFARYEHVVDRYMRTHPSGRCAASTAPSWAPRSSRSSPACTRSRMLRSGSTRPRRRSPTPDWRATWTRPSATCSPVPSSGPSCARPPAT
ncbi:MEDS domain-containing protein [Actinoplanes sp. NPDC051475]|uniref:MEDS domain-containing protein n=1 Tax=Actinoplanes sp. NPDC051475 TaxID=3157225 RepID=UPI00344F988F